MEQITIPYLKYQGIDHLDYVFLSHQDVDHIGDLQVLLKKFPVRRVCFADGMQIMPRSIDNLIHLEKNS